MTVVVDASVVVAGLASADATGEWAESVLAGEPLAAPHLMPVEAASILHRAELAGEISADAASLAHADLGRLRVEYFPYDQFAERIWELRSPGLPAISQNNGRNYIDAFAHTSTDWRGRAWLTRGDQALALSRVLRDIKAACRPYSSSF